MRPAESAFIPFCLKPHRLIDGAPLAHRCRVLPPESIAAAIVGDFDRAIKILSQAASKGPLQEHSGIWRLKRR
jgi:hypothetical protein